MGPFAHRVRPGGRYVGALGVWCAGGPDGLVEIGGDWHERDRVRSSSVLPFDLLDPAFLDRLAGANGEMPGGEWDGPVWGRVWSYDVDAECLRLTVRRSPPYACCTTPSVASTASTTRTPTRGGSRAGSGSGRNRCACRP